MSNTPYLYKWASEKKCYVRKKPKLLLWKKSTSFFHMSKGKRREKILGKKIRLNRELKKSLKSFR